MVSCPYAVKEDIQGPVSTLQNRTDIFIGQDTQQLIGIRIFD